MVDLSKARKKIIDFCEIMEFKFINGWINHPLYIGTPTYCDYKTHKITEITEDNKESIKKIFIDNLKKMKNITDMMSIAIQKPYRLDVLYFIYELLDKKLFNELLLFSWISVEFPHYHRQSELKKMFSKCDKKLMMDDEEQKYFNSLPETITIYRGFNGYKGKIKRFSWTGDFKTANFFAKRWGDTDYLYKAKIKKKDVYFYTNDRNEKEFVVNPNKLLDIEKL